MRKFALVAFVCVISAVMCPKTWAWGCQGHQLVAYIAYQHLNPQAKAQVDKLLSDPTGQYAKPLSAFEACGTSTLGAIETYSTWPDAVRPLGEAWHFWDVPLSASAAAFPDYCGTQGCIISALVAQIKILRNASSSADDTHKALMFVIHFLGDLHQPMHIVDNGDRGGNCVPVKFEGTASKPGSNGSYDPNLHSIWDNNLVSAGSGSKGRADRDKTTQDFAAKIETDESGVSADEAKQTIDFDNDQQLFIKWALATHDLAGPSSYDKLPTHIDVVASPTTLKTCAGVSSKLVKLNESVDSTFVGGAEPVVEKQLALAGGRLAAILNSLWQ